MMEFFSVPSRSIDAHRRNRGSLFSLVIFLGLGATSPVFAQLAPAMSALLPGAIEVTDSTHLPSLSKEYRLNFVVPDAPAFSVLDDGADEILRPSSVKEVAIALSSFVDTASGNITVPQAFAVEFSPGLLIGGSDLSLNDYQAAPFLYRLRVSAGTRRSSGAGSPSELALGLRTSFIDRSDLRTDRELLRAITDITNQMRDIAVNVIPAPPLPGEEEGSGAEVVEIDDPRYDSLQDRLQEMIDASRDDRRWNATALDFAAAIRLSSGDSTVTGLRTSRIGAWITYATGFGSWGQLLVGGQAGLSRDSLAADDLSFASSLAGRLYLGVNDYKMFGEVEYSARDAGDRVILNGGGEVMLVTGIWASFAGGVQRDLDAETWSVVSDFSVKLGVPFLR